MTPRPVQCPFKGMAICLVAAFFQLHFTPAAAAQGFTSRQTQIATWTVAEESTGDRLHSGSTFYLDIIATVASGWHVYSLAIVPGGPAPTRIVLPQPQVVTLNGNVLAGPAKHRLDRAFHMQTSFYEDKAIFRVPLTVNERAPSGRQNIFFDIHYQLCKAKQCKPPMTSQIVHAIAVAAD